MASTRIFMSIIGRGFLLLLAIVVCMGARSKPKIAKMLTQPANYSNKRFDEWTWLAAHNAHINWYDSGVIYVASNQNLSLDDQLQFGVRAFMFDIDTRKCSFLETLTKTCKCEGVCLCHGECSSNSFKDGFSTKSLSYALRKIVDFLTRNKNEIITVFLEDYLRDTMSLINVFERVPNLLHLQFNPYAPEWNVLQNGWPKIDDMIKADKRLLIVDDEQRGYHAGEFSGVIRSRDYLIQNHYDWLIDESSNVSMTVSSQKKLKNLLDKNYTKLLISKEGKEVNLTMQLAIPRCISVHRINGRPNWDETRQLLWNSREHPSQLLNGRKLFLFSHFYGVPAKGVYNGNYLIFDHINSREFVMRRLREMCDPNTNRKRPNYLALDFIDKFTYENVIVPFNSQPY